MWAHGTTTWLLLLIPATWLLAWAIGRASGGWQVTGGEWWVAGQSRRSWRWGRRSLSLPLAAFSLWAATSLWQGYGAENVKALSALVLVWLIYLYLINERPSPAAPLALVVLLQGIVAILQVWQQADMGLWWLGEPRLDPQDGGVNVLLVSGERWLRGYGLTGGPNALGASLAFLVFYLLPNLLYARGWRLWAWSLTISIGAVGLLASFSRSAGLAAAVGLAAWAGLSWLRDRRRRVRLTDSDFGYNVSDVRYNIGAHPAWDRQRRLAVALPVLLAVAYVLAYVPALTSRFVPDANPLEVRSINERERDANVALAIIASRPLAGVGLGNFQKAAWALDSKSWVVHNVFLLVMAELGLIGALLWIWLVVAGLREGLRRWVLPGWLLGLWVVFLAPGMFGPWWVTVSWRVGVLFALLLAASDSGDRETIVTTT